jgi:hypothetical protein
MSIPAFLAEAAEGSLIRGQTKMATDTKQDLIDEPLRANGDLPLLIEPWEVYSLLGPTQPKTPAPVIAILGLVAQTGRLA